MQINILENNGISVVREDGASCVFTVNPQTQLPFASEIEARNYVNSLKVIPFIQLEATRDPQVSPIQFKLLFNSTERLKIKELRSTDPVIDDFYEIIEDPRLEFVDFSLQSTKDGIEYLLTKLVEVGTLTEETKIARSEQILSGVLV